MLTGCRPCKSRLEKNEKRKSRVVGVGDSNSSPVLKKFCSKHGGSFNRAVQSVNGNEMSSVAGPN